MLPKAIQNIFGDHKGEECSEYCCYYGEQKQGG